MSTCSNRPTFALSAACSITAVFSPAATGVHSTDIALPHDHPESPLRIPLQGTGTTPVNITVTLSANPIVATLTSNGNGVRLSTPAPVGGAVVRLSSSNSAILTLPVSVTIPAGTAALSGVLDSARRGPGSDDRADHGHIRRRLHQRRSHDQPHGDRFRQSVAA